MRLAFLALALTLPAASSALPATPPPATPAPHRLDQGAISSRLCGDDLKVRPIRLPNGARARRLGELPPGNLTLAVLNRAGGCSEPVTVRHGYGGLQGR